MKKKGFKKLVCTGLVLTMLLGLTACGKNGSQSTGGIIGNKNEGGASTVNAALAKEYVYAEQECAHPDMGDDVGIRMMTQGDDKVYVVYEVYNWDSYSTESTMKLLSMNKDGSDVLVKDLQMSMEGASEEEVDISSEGAEKVSEEATEETIVENPDAGIATDDMAIMYDTYEYTGFDRLAVMEDKLYGIKNHYLEDYTDPDNPITLSENFVCCWDMEGTMLWESKMENLQTEESYSYIQNLIPQKSGLVILLNGDKMETMTVAEDGTFSERKALPDTVETLSYAMDTFVQPDGTITYTYWDQNDGSSLWMNSYDFSTNTEGEPMKLPDSFMMSGYNALTAGGDVADIVYSNSSGVFGLNKGDEMPKQIMSFVNSDLSTYNMNYILMLDETRFMGFYYDNIDGSSKCSIFTKVNPEDIPDKAVIVVAGNYIGYDTMERIVDFNKSSDTYRIVVKEYNSYSTMDDYMASYTQLNNDILSSGMPDILIADTNMPIDSYISKGLIADIDSLIAADEELSQVEFMQNVFDAYRVDGKLYYVIPSFYVRTMLGKTSIVGDRTTWTMQDMMDLAATLPEGTQMMGEMTRDSFIYMMMQFCGSDFVDVSTGKCEFYTDNFIAMLEYAKTLPAEYTEDYFGEDYWMNYESQYRDDRTVLLNCYVSSPRDMNRNLNGYFGEEVSYIGFPTDSGEGAVLAADSMYVLSAKSENLEGAWDFIKYYLQDEYQSELEWSLPVVKSHFKTLAYEAMENPYYLDENGEKQEYEDTFYMNGESIVIPNMSQEQADQFISFIESVNKRSYYNEDVQNIIIEEAAAFFEGQKSARDVASIIQSRVNIFVNENM